MAAPTRTPRSKWIEEGLRALATGGPDAVRIEPLANALGVSRGGFYWHFSDRSALLEEMLDSWERATTEEVIERLDRAGGDASTRLRRLLALTSSSVLMTDLAIRDWARRKRRSPSACGASTTGAWITCAHSSAPSASMQTTSRHAACSSSPC